MTKYVYLKTHGNIIVFLLLLLLTSSEVMSQVPTVLPIPISKIEFRKLKKEEIESLNFEYKEGVKLMVQLSNLKANKLTKSITLKALQEAFDSLNNITNYPIGEYSSVWHATFGLAIVFAEQLKDEFGWEWIMIENSSAIEVGWSLISADKRYGINVDQVFYRRIMLREPIKIMEFYNAIKKTVGTQKVNTEQILFFKLP